ncbi:hypothetical protein V5N11_001705 [Cardamine amara subsp. amara]|uniref:Uncharacterized protein n=1 Tax=Cardamine amara subsp. amara TaxID=228776 RepID=A0ABD1BMV8_CARAN
MADCIILSCCCECFILQVLIFVFFKIPCKLAQKMKKFVTKRLRGKKRRAAKTVLPTKEDDCREDHGSTFSCMEEDIEEILQELSMKGEFVFGSFWRQGDPSNDLDFRNSQYEIVKSSDHHSLSSLLIAQDVLQDSRIQIMKH